MSNTNEGRVFMSLLDIASGVAKGEYPIRVNAGSFKNQYCSILDFVGSLANWLYNEVTQDFTFVIQIGNDTSNIGMEVKAPARTIIPDRGLRDFVYVKKLNDAIAEEVDKIGESAIVEFLLKDSAEHNIVSIVYKHHFGTLEISPIMYNGVEVLKRNGNATELYFMLNRLGKPCGFSNLRASLETPAEYFLVLTEPMSLPYALESKFYECYDGTEYFVTLGHKLEYLIKYTALRDIPVEYMESLVFSIHYTVVKELDFVQPCGYERAVDFFIDADCRKIMEYMYLQYKEGYADELVQHYGLERISNWYAPENKLRDYVVTVFGVDVTVGSSSRGFDAFYDSIQSLPKNGYNGTYEFELARYKKDYYLCNPYTISLK